MLNGFALLLVFQLLGETAVRLAGVPLPGPVAGMVALFGWLAWRGNAVRSLEEAADALLRYLALLFVPAGVGVILYLDRVASQWAVLVATLTLSLVATLAVTGWVMQWMLRRSKGGRHGS